MEPQEQQHRLCKIPDAHLDPNMDPGYKSEESERLDRKKQGSSYCLLNNFIQLYKVDIMYLMVLLKLCSPLY